MASTWVVTGANRGIGLEFARQLSQRGEAVIATARRPEEARELSRLPVRVETLEVTDPASVASLAESLRGTPVDVLVNNAALGGPDSGVERLSMEDVARVLAVDAIGPLAVVQALLPNLRAGRARRIVSLSSGLGSISRNTDGGWYAYRAAKAALNQLTRTLAEELGREGFTAIVICPGWVRPRWGARGPTSRQRTVSPRCSRSSTGSGPATTDASSTGGAAP